MGSYGQAPGQFGEPTDATADQNGIYYVIEAYNQRVQRVAGDGTSLGQWPIPPSVALDGPHLAWASDGSLLVSAPEDGAILRYAPDGQLLNRWTQAGDSALCQPVGIYVDADTSTLYVTDTACHRVYVFEIQ